MVLLLLVVVCAVLDNFVFVFLFKRDDVSVRDRWSFDFASRHGFYWWARKPEVFYKEEHIPQVKAAQYVFVLSLLGLLWSFLAQGPPQR